MCKCCNFILRRIHVYYQAVLWIRSVIDYSMWICRNKINSDRIICGYLGLSNLLSKDESGNDNSSHFSDFSLPLPTRNPFLECQLLMQGGPLFNLFLLLAQHSARQSCICHQSSSSWDLAQVGRCWGLNAGAVALNTVCFKLTNKQTGRKSP